MTSEERKEARYQRRKAKRDEQKRIKYKDADNFEKVFQMKNIRKSYRKCRCSMGWKNAVQRYTLRSPIYISRVHKKLMSGKYKCAKPDEFDTVERGKLRHIKAIKFPDRIVQRCYCDNALVPVVAGSFIYDNSASMKYRGYHFAVSRMTCHLEKHFRKYGREGYILLFDFSKFFDNVSHETVSRILRKNFTDVRLVKFAEDFVATFGKRGVGLGSEISQIMALASANELDHHIKEKLQMKYYSRYMDDGYVISESKEELQNVLSEIVKVCKKLDISLNLKKTRIVKLTKSFSWLKVRWSITENGHVIRKIYKRSVTRMRRKIKKFPKLIAEGKLDFEHANQAFQSWCGYAKHFDSYYAIKGLNALWNETFSDYLPAKSDDKKARKEITLIHRYLAKLNKLQSKQKISEEHAEMVKKSWQRYADKVSKKYDLRNMEEDWKQLKAELFEERKVA